MDYGTQSVRALVFDANGQLITKVMHLVTPYDVPQLGWAEQDAHYCWQQVCLVLQKLWRESNIVPEQVVGISLTTQRNCIVHLDKECNPLRPLIMWPDNRRTTKLPKFSPWWKFAFGIIGMTKRIRYFQGESECNWVVQHQPEIAEQSAKIGFLSGWLNFKLSGVLADSVAAQVGYLPFDYKKRQWGKKSAWQWQAIAVGSQQMVDVVEPGDLIAKVSQQAHLDTGLVAGTPIISAGADKACETLTSGTASPNVASISLGTASTISITQRDYREAFRYLPAYPSLVENSFINEIILQRGFWLLTHFIEQYGQADVEEAQRLGVKPEELICRRILDIDPGANGLIVQPFWAPGVIYPGPEARGSIVGFTPDHTRYHLYRALIEGILLSLKQGLARLEKIAPQKIDLIRISGGGSQSDVVMQMASDIFNLPCERVQTHETSGLGAAIACAKGVGFYNSISEGAKAMVKHGKRFEPSNNATIYQQIYQQKSAKIYDYLKPFYNKYE
ncbi:MAG: FGGY-family carbohydrate kinase [Psychrobium sp.]